MSVPLRIAYRSFLWTTCLVISSVGMQVEAKERQHSKAVTTSGDAPSKEASGIVLKPRSINLFRVRIELELEGNVDVPKNALVSRTRAIQVPIKSDATFDYEERFRRPPGTDTGEVTAMERHYHEAWSRSELNRNQHTAELRESVRSSVVRREMLPEVIYATDDYYHQDELELLRTPVSSVAVDQLLPEDAVQIGSTYAPSRNVMVSLLNLTSVETSDVVAEVVAITDQQARIQFRGKVAGSVEVVPTEIRTLGKLTFDRKLGTCTWLAIALHETREIGIAEPGFDIAAKVKMIREPLQQPYLLPEAPQPIDVMGPIPKDRLYNELVSDHLGFSTLVDRRWRMMRDVAGAAMMRMVETDRVVAQCDIRRLPSLKAGTQRTLQAFQKDVQQTLGDQLTDLIEAEESVSATGLRVLRVVAQGSAEGVPIQWVMLHLSDDSGKRLLVSFTMEAENVPEFAGSDTQIAGTLEFLPSQVIEAGGQVIEAGGQAIEAGGQAIEAGDSDQEISPREAGSEVAQANQGGNAEHKVQSQVGRR